MCIAETAGLNARASGGRRCGLRRNGGFTESRVGDDSHRALRTTRSISKPRPGGEIKGTNPANRQVARARFSILSEGIPEPSRLNLGCGLLDPRERSIRCRQNSGVHFGQRFGWTQCLQNAHWLKYRLDFSLWNVDRARRNQAR